jgi:uncharacterized membrane protein YgaE (UPF0421/DUF939 family)
LAKISLSDELHKRLAALRHRLRGNGWPILQTAIAAGLAYFLATFVLGNEQAFFAPIAAVISLGLSVGQRGRRALEVAVGVAIGLAVADLIVLVIGVGPVQIAAVVALAMATSVLFTERNLFVNQAAISAILVVVLTPPQEGFNPERFINALVGGGVAVGINYLLPVNPERLVQRAAREVFDELASVLERIAVVLREGDREQAERNLYQARAVDDRVRSFDERLAAGHETARLSPTRRRALKRLDLYASASVRMELAVINTRVLARGAANVIRRGDSVPTPIPDAVLDLSHAVKELAAYLEQSEGPEETRASALAAARGATRTFEDHHDLATSVLVGQIRSAAVDILRSTGMDQASALSALEDAAGKDSDLG